MASPQARTETFAQPKAMEFWKGVASTDDPSVYCGVNMFEQDAKASRVFRSNGGRAESITMPLGPTSIPFPRAAACVP